jgi:hypothetical protein
MTEYDRWLDDGMEDWYCDGEEVLEGVYDEPDVEPNTDYDNYDGWDDMQ